MQDSEINDITGEDSIIPLEEARSVEVENTDGFVCPVCNKSFTTQLAMIGHQRTHNKGKLSTKKNDSLNTIPTSISHLEELLAGYNVPSRNGILLSVRDNPEDIDELREALKSVRVDKNTADYIIKKYAKSIGKSISTEGTTGVSPKEPDAIDDILARKKKEADLRMYDSYIQNGSNNGSKTNPELEAMKVQVAKMEESNRRLEDMLLKQQTDAKIAALEAEMKNREDRFGGQVAQLADALKDFATVQKHESDLLRMEVLHTREKEKLQQEVDKATKGANAQERFQNRLADAIENVGAGVGQHLVKFGENTVGYDSLKTMKELSDRGFSPEEVKQIMMARRGPVPHGTSEADWEKLRRITEAEEQKKAMQAQTTEVVMQPSADNGVKFIGNEDE